jgi:tryptophanyl-tRNA synthetase
MYPVLMAADIMLYQTDRVPIGDDQRQHLELTRHLVERFNRRYGETFRVPEGIFPEVGARIMDLQDPRRKMSTTGGTELGTIGILDPPEVVSRKVKSAVTDPESEVRLDPDRKPGISNLMEIMYVATGEAIDSIEARNVARGYGAFKQEVADAVIAVLEPVREAYGPIRADETELRRVLAMGSAKARAMSAPTLDRMRDAMGFVRRESRP